jgi:hypothetical protein
MMIKDELNGSKQKQGYGNTQKTINKIPIHTSSTVSSGVGLKW